MRPRDEELQRRGRALIDLVVPHFPKEYDLAQGDWPAVGVGLLSRMTTTLGSVLDLQFGEREADSSILTRSLYEHAFHFAWLAAAPTPRRIGEWRWGDLNHRIKADNDARHHGIQLLTPQRRAEFEHEMAELNGKPLKLVALATVADEYWGGRVPGNRPGTQCAILSRSLRKPLSRVQRHGAPIRLGSESRL